MTAVMVATLLVVMVAVHLLARERFLADHDAVIDAQLAAASELALAHEGEALGDELFQRGIWSRVIAPDGAIQEIVPPLLVLDRTSAWTGRPSQFRSRSVTLPDGRLLEVSVASTQLHRSLRTLLAIQTLALTLAVAAAWTVVPRTVSRTLRPLRDLVETADRIAGGEQSVRASTPSHPVEVAELAAAVDAMVDSLGAAHDQVKDAEERSRRFLVWAAHQLKRPSAAVVAAASALETSGPAAADQEHRRLLRLLVESGRRTGELVDELLLVARLEQRGAGAREAVDLNCLVAEEVAHRRDVDPTVAVEFSPAGGLPEVAGDRLLLREGVGNLLDNAIRHAVSHVQVSVRDSTGVLEIGVRDDGPKPESFDPTAVEPFTRTSRDGGTGLGLWLVGRIMSAHGGAVEYHSGEIRLRIPCANRETNRT